MFGLADREIFSITQYLIANFATATNKEDTEMALRTFLETELGFGDAANVEIQRVHRLEKERRKFQTHTC